MLNNVSICLQYKVFMQHKTVRALSLVTLCFSLSWKIVYASARARENLIIDVGYR